MRVNAYIDGFNFYHTLASRERPELNKYKWLDYKKLVKMFLHPSDKLGEIYYFTAIPYWNQQKVTRHCRFAAALQSVGVKMVEGRFQEVTKDCRSCNNEYTTHEEKRTDVNIAVTLIRHAIEDSYDKALIFSADSDLIPAIECVNTLRSDKRIEVVIPIHANATQIKDAAFRASQVNEKHLRDAQFPNTIEWLHRGKTNIISKPIEWG